MSNFVPNELISSQNANTKVSFNRFKGRTPLKNTIAKNANQNIKYHETLYKKDSIDTLKKIDIKDTTASTIQNFINRSFIGNWYNRFSIKLCEQNISTTFSIGSSLHFSKSHQTCFPATDLFYTLNDGVTFYLTIDSVARAELIKLPDIIINEFLIQHGSFDTNYNPTPNVVPWSIGWKQAYQEMNLVVQYNNDTYSSTKILGRCKGYSSFAPYNKKMALRLKKLNSKIDGLETVTDIALNNMISDPSKLNEYLIYKIFNDYGMPAPRANYCRLFINDTTIAIYSLDDNSITTTSSHYLKNGTKIKFANDLNTTFYVINSNINDNTFKISLSLNGPEFSLNNLNYSPTQFYFDHGEYINVELVQNEYRIQELFGSNNTKHLYEVDPINGGFETDYGNSDRTDLYNFLDKISPHPDFHDRLYSVADVDHFIKHAVIEFYCGNPDGFYTNSIFANGINAHLHSDKNGIFRIIPWGVDGYFASHDLLLSHDRLQLELWGGEHMIKLFVQELLKFHNWISKSNIVDSINRVFAQKVDSFIDEKNPAQGDPDLASLEAFTNAKNNILSLLANRSEVIDKFLERPYPVNNLQATLKNGTLSVSWDPVTRNLKEEDVTISSYTIKIAEDGGSTNTIQTTNTRWSSSNYANTTAKLTITVTPNYEPIIFNNSSYTNTGFISIPAVIPSTVTNTQPVLPLMRITEVMSDGQAPFAKDWFEITNFGSPVTMSGWKMDDGSFQSINAVNLTPFGLWSTIGNNESVVCIETSTPNIDIPLFSGLWGSSNFTKFASYSGLGVGLSSAGDGVIVFDNNDNELHRVFFNKATKNQSFYWRYNTSGNIVATGVNAIGIYGAYAASGQIASPGVY